MELSIEEIEPRLIELQQLGERASAHVESEDEEEMNEESGKDICGESSSENKEVNEEKEVNPSAEFEVDIEVQNTEGGDANITVVRAWIENKCPQLKVPFQEMLFTEKKDTHDVSQRDDDIKGYKYREEKNLSVIEKQKGIISDMEDDASVHDISQKTALDAEIMCLKELITEKDNIITQQSVMLDFLQTQNPTHEPKALEVIPLKSHAPDNQYVDVDIEETRHPEKNRQGQWLRESR
ncbi:hypothetical protein QJS10_CPB12g00676 [Acorus calamus]|uniref:Uncharacterized protein n=1 Tax=Acorus calamus TaxID=4465 RepID=A0AAV9DMP9_ACOCL|nr:hypothetical protein QJS10_CPB12g00676 [Acorus calamus]